MSLKASLLFQLKRFMSALGITAFFFPKNAESKHVVIDLMHMSRYQYPDYTTKLYESSMYATKSESRNVFVKQCRYYVTMKAAYHVLDAGVPGSFAECGCWRGQSAHMVATVLKDRKSDRRLYVFDSFEGGLSDKTDEDKDQMANVDPEYIRKEKESFSVTVEEVAENLKEFPFVSLHKGWIPEAFSVADDEKFAFVYLDLDLYEPIRDSLEFFYPRLADGGIIVIDDYAASFWPGVQKSVDEFLANNKTTFSLETIGNMVILK